MKSPVKTILFLGLALGCMIAAFRAENVASVSLLQSLGIVSVLMLFKSMSNEGSTESRQNKS